MILLDCSRYSIVTGILASAILTVALTGAFASETIGSAIGITNEVTGSLGPAQTQLQSGDPIFQSHLIATGDESQAQLEFSDNTNLAVSANSTIMIDKHVYDPDMGTGEIALNAVGGAFRFVTGLVPKQNIVINTPSAALGVRGTTFDLYVHENGETAITLVEGEVEVCNARRSCRVLNQIGKVMHITVDGVISEALEWTDNLVRGVQHAAAFPFLSTSKRTLNSAFYASGNAMDKAVDGGKKAGKATVNGVKRASASGADLAEDTGTAVVNGSKKVGSAVSNSGKKARRTAKKTGKKALRTLRKIMP